MWVPVGRRPGNRAKPRRAVRYPLVSKLLPPPLPSFFGGSSIFVPEVCATAWADVVVLGRTGKPIVPANGTQGTGYCWHRQRKYSRLVGKPCLLGVALKYVRIAPPSARIPNSRVTSLYRITAPSHVVHSYVVVLSSGQPKKRSAISQYCCKVMPPNSPCCTTCLS